MAKGSPTAALRSLSRAYAEAARAPSTQALCRYDFRVLLQACRSSA
jgi:hypothetical protein